VKISLSWLREFVDITESTEIRVILDDLGLVVEGVERVGEGLEGRGRRSDRRDSPPLRALTECDSSSWTPVTVPSRSSVAP